MNRIKFSKIKTIILLDLIIFFIFFIIYRYVLYSSITKSLVMSIGSALLIFILSIILEIVKNKFSQDSEE